MDHSNRSVWWSVQHTIGKGPSRQLAPGDATEMSHSSDPIYDRHFFISSATRPLYTPCLDLDECLGHFLNTLLLRHHNEGESSHFCWHKDLNQASKQAGTSSLHHFAALPCINLITTLCLSGKTIGTDLPTSSAAGVIGQGTPG